MSGFSFSFLQDDVNDDLMGFDQLLVLLLSLVVLFPLQNRVRIHWEPIICRLLFPCWFD